MREYSYASTRLKSKSARVEVEVQEPAYQKQLRRLRLKGGSCDTRPFSTDFPVVIRDNEPLTTVLSGTYLHRNSCHAVWTPSSLHHWCNTRSFQFVVWQCQKLNGSYVGRKFVPCRGHTYLEIAQPGWLAPFWYAMAWKATPQEVPEEVVSTLRILEQITKLPQHFVVECAGQSIIRVIPEWECLGSLIVESPIDKAVKVEGSSPKYDAYSRNVTAPIAGVLS